MQQESFWCPFFLWLFCYVIGSIGLKKYSVELQMITTILDGLNNTLSKAGEDSEVILTQMKEADGLDMIEKLQQHGDQNIYRLACSIKSHFPDVVGVMKVFGIGSY